MNLARRMKASLRTEYLVPCRSLTLWTQLHREDIVPAGAVLVHAGNFTMFSKSLLAVEGFNEWIGTLPPAYKICIPGIMSSYLESDPRRRSLISNGVVLINEGVHVEGLHVWGLR